MADDIRDFTLSVPEATLTDLRERLRRGRLPEAETVTVPGPAVLARGRARGHFPALEVPASYVAEIQQSLALMASE